MPQFVPLEVMEAAHAAYNDCTQQLSDALNEAPKSDDPKEEWLHRIKELNERCDQCLQKYLAAFERYYGQGSKGAEINTKQE
jgi:hypothetical protein